MGTTHAMSSLEAVMNKDQFARHCGIELVHVHNGRASARMTLGPQHMNGVGIVHGGAIFTLADYAFAAAANSHGYVAVAVNANVQFVKVATEGRLYAEAEEVTVTRKLGSYTVIVTDQAGEIVAIFQGLAYRKDTPGAGAGTKR
jgi:acyl-CoA thioesterase